MAEPKIQGLKELHKEIKKLGPKIERKVVSKGIRSSANVLRAAALISIDQADLSPSGKATLRRALKIRQGNSRSLSRKGYIGGGVYITSGVKYQKLTKKKKDGTVEDLGSGDAWWWRLIERGTDFRKQKKTGRATGAVAPRNIFRKAFDSVSEDAVGAGWKKMIAEAKKELEK